MNIGDPDRVLTASARVLEIQTKLHRWAKDGPARRFDDLFNLVVDPAFLIVAWDRVRNNKGARTAGVDGFSAYYVEQVRGVGAFLADLREQVRSGEFRPLPVRERMIPKANGKRRALGIPTVRDRVVQAALKLCWSLSSRRISSRAPTGSAPTAGPRTPSPRSTSSLPAPTSGFSRGTSRRVSTGSTTSR